MKITRYLALAVVLIGTLFAISAFAERVPAPETNAPAVIVESDLLSNERVQPSQRFTVCDAVNTALLSNEIRARESVGMPVLNIRTASFKTVDQLEGFSEVQIKPKITTTNTTGAIGFNGLGRDRFARAGV